VANDVLAEKGETLVISCSCCDRRGPSPDEPLALPAGSACNERWYCRRCVLSARHCDCERQEFVDVGEEFGEVPPQTVVQ
jgi:hypothetical protein